MLNKIFVNFTIEIFLTATPVDLIVSTTASDLDKTHTTMQINLEIFSLMKLSDLVT